MCCNLCIKFLCNFKYPLDVSNDRGLDPYPICVGFITSLQTQKRHVKILNGDSEFSYKVVSCGKKLDFTKKISSSCARTRKSTLIRTFDGASDSEVVLQPQDDYGATWQSIFWKKWDAFVKFSRPFTVIYVVSTSVCIFCIYK